MVKDELELFTVVRDEEEEDENDDDEEDEEEEDEDGKIIGAVSKLLLSTL